MLLSDIPEERGFLSLFPLIHRIPQTAGLQKALTCSILKVQMVEIPLRCLNCWDHTFAKNLENVLPKSQDDWSRKTFYSYWNVKIKISSSDKHMFKITQSVMDWEKIASK